jgi:transposase
MYSPEIVMEAIDLYYKNISFNKISKKLKISRQIISIWIKKYKYNFNFIIERIKKTKYEIDKYKTIKHLHIDVILFIKNLILIDPFIKKYDIINHVKNKFNIKITLNNITIIYKKLNLSFKKPKYFPIKDLEYLEELIKKRKQFTDDINKENIHKIISIDESSFNKYISYKKGLSEIGKRIHIPLNNQVKYKNISLIMAITTSNIVHHELINKYVDSDIFYNFINTIINKLTEKNYIFILDNYSIHKTKSVINLIKNAGHKIIFTPPYSPNNNPIENVFGLIKNNYFKLKKDKLNTKLKTFNQININYINTAINNFINNYKYKLLFIFQHAFNYNYSKINQELKDRLIIR